MLTPAQQNTIIQVVNVFETGRPLRHRSGQEKGWTSSYNCATFSKPHTS